MNATEMNDEEPFQISKITDLKTGKISVTSPIGKGLVGKSVGETAEINVPNGVLKFEVLEISRD